MTESNQTTEFERYNRQTRFAPIGADGQRKLCDATVLLVGCGALGSFIANILARSGVGHLLIADRDFLELSNLQRQVLFDETDIAAGYPKAVAASKKLALINSEIKVTPIVKDVDYQNIEQWCDGIDLILDGTDNFETRFLINDVSAKLNIPWIYGGCLGASGQSMTIVPGRTACLHCLMSEGPPQPGTSPTCDTAGIIAPIIANIASVQSAEAIKLLCGEIPDRSKLLIIDLWETHVRYLDLQNINQSQSCPVCDQGKYFWLSGEKASFSAILCGRNSVQLNFPEQQSVELKSVASKLQGIGEVSVNEFMLRFSTGENTITLFADGRAIVSGTDDIAKAKSIYTQYIGA